MRVACVFAFVSLVGASTAALAQPNEAEFHDEVLRRLDRIERTLERIERDSDRALGPPTAAPRDDEVVAATSEVCGTTMANCQREALRYCERLNYTRGVPLRIEPRGGFNYMIRVRCFN